MVKPQNGKFVKLYHDKTDKTSLTFTDLPIYPIYLCPGTAKFTTLPIYDLPNLPLPGERSLLSIMPYTVAA